MNQSRTTDSFSPYLSVVVCSRNDDHGGRLIDRTQSFIDGLSEQSRRFNLETELVIVEWNPPPDRPRFSEVFRWPKRRSNFMVRIIEVPPELHKQFKHSDALQIFQMIGKNVGIKAAKGRFVLATNPDILLSNGVFRYLAARKLRSGRYYRAERFDVPNDVPDHGSVDEQLVYCREHVLRAWKRTVSIDYLAGTAQLTYPESKGSRQINGLLWAIGLFLVLDLFRKKYEPVVRNLRSRKRPPNDRPATPSIRRFAQAWKDIRNSYLTVGSKFPQVKALQWGDFLLARLEGLGSRLADLRLTVGVPGVGMRRAVIRVVQTTGAILSMPPPSQPRLFTMASGDFTLLSKKNWEDLRGYPEFPIFSLHIDSLLLYAAHYCGFEQVCLSDPTYHIDHSRGWVVTKDSATPYADLVRKGVPILSIQDFYGITGEMAKRGNHFLFNTKDWGLGNQVLPEVDPQGAEAKRKERSGEIGESS